MPAAQLGKQQFETAAEWFEQAASRGMTDSQFNLGMLYARGLGVPQNLENSYKWFSLAARSGDADAAKARDDIARSLDADAVKRLNDESGRLEGRSRSTSPPISRRSAPGRRASIRARRSRRATSSPRCRMR